VNALNIIKLAHKLHVNLKLRPLSLCQLLIGPRNQLRAFLWKLINGGKPPPPFKPPRRCHYRTSGRNTPFSLFRIGLE